MVLRDRTSNRPFRIRARDDDFAGVRLKLKESVVSFSQRFLMMFKPVWREYSPIEVIRLSESVLCVLFSLIISQGINPDVRYEVQYSSYVNITTDGFLLLKKAVRTESFALQASIHDFLLQIFTLTPLYLCF